MSKVCRFQCGMLLLTLGCKPLVVSEKQPAVPATPEPNSLALSHSTGCSLTVMSIERTDYRYTLYDQLMRLALSKSDESDGPCQYNEVQIMSHGRKFLAVNSGKLDIVGNVASRHLVEEHDAVKIPVHKGLHGLRLLLIRRGDEARFAAIKNLADLQSMRAGVVHDWQVADVLAENGLPLSPNSDYESLFRMLQFGRIDYIPLAIFEASKELAKRPQYDLTIEPTLLLIYPSTDYFFVNKARPELRDRLSRGLSKTIADGSRDGLIEQIHQLSATIKATNVAKRMTIHLTNANDPADAPRDVADYWHQLSQK